MCEYRDTTSKSSCFSFPIPFFLSFFRIALLPSSSPLPLATLNDTSHAYLHLPSHPRATSRTTPVPPTGRTLPRREEKKRDLLTALPSCSFSFPFFRTCRGVMSGIITGPYFKSYFHRPNAFELATMVAILEIGAFSTPPPSSSSLLPVLMCFPCSYESSRRNLWRPLRKKGGDLRWSLYLHPRRSLSSFHNGVPSHGLWTNSLWCVALSLPFPPPHLPSSLIKTPIKRRFRRRIPIDVCTDLPIRNLPR
jgi:hypothetical protein